MDTLFHVIQLMTPGCFMASVDLKDAYYSIPVAQEDRKYLRFVWENTLYQFTCLPNGLAEAPRKFTKILKVPFSELRGQGHESSVYLDDSALFGLTFDDCVQNITSTVETLDSLGFTIHPDKSVTFPSHVLTFLGFVLNSIEMTVTLTLERRAKIKTVCSRLLDLKKVTVRQLAEVIGTLVAVDPASDCGPIYIIK